METERIYASDIQDGINDFELCKKIADAFNVTNETGLTPRELLSQRDELVELIHDAGSQIEYLHDKFSETGTGNNVLSRIKSLLTKINTKP